MRFSAAKVTDFVCNCGFVYGCVARLSGLRTYVELHWRRTLVLLDFYWPFTKAEIDSIVRMNFIISHIN